MHFRYGQRFAGMLLTGIVGLGCEAAPSAAPEPSEEVAVNEVEKPTEPPASAEANLEVAAPGLATSGDVAEVGAAVESSPPSIKATPQPPNPKPDPKPEKSVNAKPTGPVIGEPSTAVASAAAEPGYKCNDAFPHKFTASGGRNVEYPQQKVRAACAGKGVSVSVPYIPKAAQGAVVGTLKYGICDDAKTNCRILTKAVTVAFEATKK